MRHASSAIAINPRQRRAIDIQFSPDGVGEDGMPNLRPLKSAWPRMRSLGIEWTERADLPDAIRVIRLERTTSR